MIWTISTYRPRVKARPESFGDHEMVNGSNVASVALARCSRWTPGIDWNARAWKDSASTALVDDVGVISTKEEARNRGGLERARWSATPSEPNISTTTQDTLINHLCRFDGFESKSDICVGSNQ